MSFSSQFQSFLVHLDELRRRLIKIVILFIAASCVCYNAVGSLLPILIKPAGHLVYTTPTEAFSAYMTLSMVLGFLVTLPWTVYQLWAFIASALRERERRFIKIFAPLSLVFFVAGVAFAFFVAIPLTYRFLMSFSSAYMQPMITVNSYLGFMAHMLLAFGVAFELPLILAFLAMIGVATPEFLRQKRRHAIMIILILSMLITPPDVISMLVLAVPLVFLYELGIVMVRFSYKRSF